MRNKHLWSRSSRVRISKIQPSANESHPIQRRSSLSCITLSYPHSNYIDVALLPASTNLAKRSKQIARDRSVAKDRPSPDPREQTMKRGQDPMSKRTIVTCD